jgi:hypothetical protein
MAYSQYEPGTPMSGSIPMRSAQRTAGNATAPDEDREEEHSHARARRRARRRHLRPHHEDEHGKRRDEIDARVVQRAPDPQREQVVHEARVVGVEEDADERHDAEPRGRDPAHPRPRPAARAPDR